MNPMYQAMMAQDPMAAQQSQMGYYRPLQLQGQPQQQTGNSLAQMMQMAQAGRDKRIGQVDALSADGGAAL